jgi:hypothetical protein
LTLYIRRRYVNLVRKKYVSRETPDSFPGNFLTLLAKGADFFYLFALSIAAHVAAQTQRRRRAARRRLFLRPLMTGSAGKIERPCVSLMRERYRLLDAGLPTGPVTPGQASSGNQKDQNDLSRSIPRTHPAAEVSQGLCHPFSHSFPDQIRAFFLKCRNTALQVCIVRNEKPLEVTMKSGENTSRRHS